MSVRETYRILECTKLSELADLSANQRDLYCLIISAKVVEFDEGSFSRPILFAMFPVGSVTGDKLRDPANGLMSLPLTPNQE